MLFENVKFNNGERVKYGDKFNPSKGCSEVNKYGVVNEISFNKHGQCRLYQNNYCFTDWVDPDVSLEGPPQYTFTEYDSLEKIGEDAHTLCSLIGYDGDQSASWYEKEVTNLISRAYKRGRESVVISTIVEPLHMI
jgi:hypothetical protein